MSAGLAAFEDASWPVFLAIFLPVLAFLLTAALIFSALINRLTGVPPEPRKVSSWHAHQCGCICADKIAPCRHHKGRAAAVLHQEKL